MRKKEKILLSLNVIIGISLIITLSLGRNHYKQISENLKYGESKITTNIEEVKKEDTKIDNSKKEESKNVGEVKTSDEGKNNSENPTDNNSTGNNKDTDSTTKQ